MTRSLQAFLYVAGSDDSGHALADYTRLVKTLKTRSSQGKTEDAIALFERNVAANPIRQCL